MERISIWLNRYSLYIALIAAWIAMCGSLYFSEVKGYVPCTLCWYQRILMYPLTAILAVGLLRRDWHVPYYVLPLSVFGLGISTYHYLLEKTDIFAGAAACRQGVSCTTQWINWFGFVTIPFLALTAFLIITIMSVVALVNREPVDVDEEGDLLRTPWLPVAVPIVAVLLIFAVLFVGGTPAQAAAADSVANTAAFPVADVTPGPQQAAAHANHDPATLERGGQLYREACAACHGIDAKGVANLGNQLAGSEFVAGKTDAELLAMIREGRDLNHPENTTGLVMPPGGGRPDLSDQDLLAVIAFVRSQP
jgi:disulfide bond formation protein DsbB/mono/diheme cytochrome c family protein